MRKSTLCTNEIPVTHLAWMCLRCQVKSLKLLRHRKWKRHKLNLESVQSIHPRSTDTRRLGIIKPNEMAIES